MLYTKECVLLNAFYELQIIKRTSNSKWAFYTQRLNIIKNDSKNDVIIYAQGELYLVQIVYSI